MDAESVLRQVLAETEQLLAQSEVELRRLEEHVRRLEAERQGLRLAIVRQGAEGGVSGDGKHRGRAGLPGPEGPARGQEEESWPRLSRAEAVFRILESDGRALSRLEIKQKLKDAGRTGDDADAVSAALAYLRRVGRAERVGQGQWAVRAAGEDLAQAGMVVAMRSSRAD